MTTPPESSAREGGKLDPPCPGREAAVKDARHLSHENFRLLVGRRMRQLVDPRAAPTRTNEARREQEAQINQFFERISGGADFLPVSFLAEGAEKARAICRITRGQPIGTGFLIAPGILMTNNHVIRDVGQAEASTAEFDFEDGLESMRVRVRPGQLFITDRPLDFTIVACETLGLDGIEPIPLRRNPATATRHDRVNIIQHPQGRAKEVALHDNKVIEIFDSVVHYSTDTEPGSSGSAVFNNAWELVALHHAGWNDVPGGPATNEGIRMTAIVDRLLRRVRARDEGHESARAVLDTVRLTSPYLGFFDVEGFDHRDDLEVVVNDFRGNGQFADVGVWNIEHFNDGIDNDRVAAVANVIERLSLDVYGLTEVANGAMNRLVEAMGRRGFAMDFVLGDVRGRQDLAVLFDAETTQAQRRDELLQTYERQLSAKTSTDRSAFPRKPLFVECTVGEGGDEVSFLMIVVHLKAFGDAQSRERRRLAARMLAEIVNDLTEHQELPVVLGGDFNERLHTGVLDDLQHSPDLFAMTADDLSDDAISYVGRRHRSLIDHVLVSRDVQLGDIAGDDAAIVRLDRSVSDFSNDVSDHIPIVFRMVYRETPIVGGGGPLVEPRLEAVPQGPRSMLIRLVTGGDESVKAAAEMPAITLESKQTKTKQTKRGPAKR